MAIEFLTTLSNSTLVKPNQNQTNRFNEEINKKIEVSKLNQEQLNKVTEKISTEPDQTSTLRFQENIPLTGALRTIKIFNETKKTNPIENDSLEDLNEISDSDIEDSEETSKENNVEEIGKGYYVVSQNVASPKGKLLPVSDEDLIRNKLKEMYDPSSKKENGSLVNLTF